MVKTYAQMEERAISKANAVTATEALKLLESDPDALLVDVRDESEVETTGLGLRAITAPGRSIAWMADLESEYRSQELQDRSRLYGPPNYLSVVAIYSRSICPVREPRNATRASNSPAARSTVSRVPASLIL